MSSTPMTPNLTELQRQLATSRPLQALLAACRAGDIPIYLVGGAVRDLLLKNTLSKDLDVVVPPDQAEPLARQMAEALDGKCICLDPHFRIYRVIVFPELEMLDIAGCIGADIHADLLRRDYTINAMGYDFQTGQLMDPTGGQADLARGTLRMVSEFNMLDDPLRMLRAFRIGAELGFTDITPETLAVIRTNGGQVLKSAVERIHYELMRLFSAPRCFAQVKMMGETGLLEHLFPELTPCHAVPANRYHHLPLFEHTLELLNQAELHADDMPEPVREYLDTQVNPFIKHIAWARLACLFHDIGKPDTMAYDAEQDKYKFYGHEEVSETLTQGIAQRFKWGKETTKAVGHLVRWHLYPEAVLRPEASERAHRKFFRRIGELLPEMMVLALADRFSAQGPAISQAELADSKQRLLSLWPMYQTFKAGEASNPKLLSGKEVMELLNLVPGPEVGQILNAVSDAYLTGELSSEPEARQWVLQRFGKDKSGSASV